MSDLSDNMSGVKLPNNFPKDVYISAGAEIFNAFEKEGRTEIHFTVKKKTVELLNEYKEKMKANNWKIVDSSFDDVSANATFEKDQRSVELYTNYDEGESTVLLSHTDRNKLKNAGGKPAAAGSSERAGEKASETFMPNASDLVNMLCKFRSSGEGSGQGSGGPGAMESQLEVSLAAMKFQLARPGLSEEEKAKLKEGIQKLQEKLDELKKK